MTRKSAFGLPNIAGIFFVTLRQRKPRAVPKIGTARGLFFIPAAVQGLRLQAWLPGLPRG